MRFFSVLVIVSVLLLNASAQTKYVQPTANIKQLKFLGEYVVPHNMEFKSTTIGGLSGLDYDAEHNIYYSVSDDRSEHNPARFYVLKINISPKGIDTVMFQDVRNMLQPDGTVYPNKKQNPYKTPDPEAMRYNPTTKNLIWTSEGERD